MKNNIEFFESIYAFIISILAIIGIATIFVVLSYPGKKDSIHTVNNPVNQSVIQWVYDDNLINQKFEEYYNETGKKISGLAVFSNSFDYGGKTTTLCTIYAPLPTGENDKQSLIILGHETLHCFSGQFHE